MANVYIGNYSTNLIYLRYLNTRSIVSHVLRQTSSSLSLREIDFAFLFTT